MNRLNRRRFLALGAASTASVVLVACGNESPSEETLRPTQMPDVAGAPPTLAPITGTPQTEAGGGGDTGGGGEAGATVTIKALDSLAFDPAELEVAPGQTLVLQNDGFLQHDLAVDDWGGELTPLLNNAETAEFTIPEDAAVGDSFEYFCTVPGHKEGGMVGTFTIVEAGSETAGAAGEEEATAGAAEETGSGEAVTIVALDSLSFDPSELEVSPGQVLTLQNDGFLQHDLAVDDWGGELTPLLNNGETAEFTIPEDAAVGEQFEYYCTVPGHKEGGMVGTFTIVEGGGGGGAAVAAEEEAPAEEEATAEDEPAAGTAEGAATGETVTMIALDSFAYDPSELEVSPGQALVLQNDGFLQHDIAVDEWGGALTPLLNNGETVEFTIPEDAAVGESFEYYCTVPGHKEGGMVGTFTIVEGSGDADAAGEEEDAAAGAAGETGGGEAITMIALDSFAYDPSELDVAPGQAMVLQNDGFLQHDIAVDAWGGALTPLLNNSETAEFTIPADAAVGEQFEFYCTVPGHKEGGMVGTFTVVEGGGSAPAAAPADAGEEEGEATAAASPEAASDPNNVQVTATEWEFQPADFEVAPGGKITLTNNGTVEHGMTAEAFGGAFIDAGAGRTGEFTVPTDAQVGDTIEYTATNSSASGLGMGGTITIVEGDGAAAGATPAASPAAAEESSTGGSDAVEIVAADISFDQSELSIAADTDVTVTLHNEGVLEHDFVVEDTDFATEIIPGGETTDVVVNLPAGEYTYFCSVPGHRQAGMEGTLKVG